MNYMIRLRKKINLDYYVNLSSEIQTKKDGISEIEAYVKLKMDMAEGIDDISSKNAAKLLYLGDLMLKLDESSGLIAYFHLVQKKHKAIDEGDHETAQVYRDVQLELQDRLNPLYNNAILLTLIDFYETKGKSELEAESDLESSVLEIVGENDLTHQKMDQLYAICILMSGLKHWKHTNKDAEGFDEYFDNLKDFELMIKERELKRLSSHFN